MGKFQQDGASVTNMFSLDGSLSMNEKMNLEDTEMAASSLQDDEGSLSSLYSFDPLLSPLPPLPEQMSSDFAFPLDFENGGWEAKEESDGGNSYYYFKEDSNIGGSSNSDTNTESCLQTVQSEQDLGSMGSLKFNDSDEGCVEVSNLEKQEHQEKHETCASINLDNELPEPVRKRLRGHESKSVDTKFSSSFQEEFHVLDEARADDKDELDADDSIDEEEVEALLEQGLKTANDAPEQVQKTTDTSILDHEVKNKIVLKEKGSNVFDILPEGWMEVYHCSGMPIYLHTASRVCTMSRPYFIGPGSVRYHEIPLNAIPCLQYKKELEKEKYDCKTTSEVMNCNTKTSKSVIGAVDDGRTVDNESKVSDFKVENTAVMNKTCVEEKSHVENPLVANSSLATSSSSAGKVPLSAGKIKPTVVTTEGKSVDGETLRSYCEKLFEFHTITVRRFKSWKCKRTYDEMMRKQSRPMLAPGTKLISCTVPSDDKSDNARKKSFTINPDSKTSVCILHEYVQHVIKTHPTYVFEAKQNGINPYSATVKINGIAYGEGVGVSKKAAKLSAAETALKVLIPDLPKLKKSTADKKDEDSNLSYFYDVKIEDPRVVELAMKAGYITPYPLLLECLKRNFGMGDTQVHCKVNVVNHGKNEFTMTVGKHTVTVFCKNKRQGKQIAAQKLLKKLHSHIDNYGSLLRLYGINSGKTMAEKRPDVTTVSKAPDMGILRKLKDELERLAEQKDAMHKGKLGIETLIPPQIDNSNNLNSVDL